MSQDEIKHQDVRLQGLIKEHKTGDVFSVAWKHTYLVRILRILFPVLGLLLLLVIVIWPHFSKDDDYKAVAIKETTLEMENTRYMGTDAKQHEFSVVSDKAIRKSADSDVVELINPVAEMTLSPDSWVALKAEKGIYDRVKFNLDLKGIVNIFYGDGYILDAKNVFINFAAQEATSKEQILGHGPKGSLEAASFDLLDHGQVLRFNGPAKLVFIQKDKR